MPASSEMRWRSVARMIGRTSCCLGNHPKIPRPPYLWDPQVLVGDIAFNRDFPDDSRAEVNICAFRAAAHVPPSLRRLFEAAGLGDPHVQRFDLSYLASDLVARSFPVNNDRAGLLTMIEATVEGDKMDVGAHWTPEGVRFAFRSAVLSAVKPGQFRPKMSQI
jgi:hypothetical protein